MTATQQSPDTKPDTPPPAGPSVKSVAFGSAATVTVLGTTVALVAPFPFGLIAAGVVTIGGVTVARAIKPRARKTTPGLLHALIGRPRRTITARTGAEWARSLTRTRRGRSTSMSPSGPIGRRRGGLPKLGLPQLPALTAKGRAKRAAAAAAASHRKPAMKGSAPRALANRPGTKPSGIKAPGTGSRTPARAGAARKLATAPGRTRTPQAGGRGPVRSRLTPTGRTGTGPKLGTGRTGVRRTGSRGGIRVPGAGMKTGIRSGLGRSVSRPGKTSSTGRSPLPTLRHRKPVASSRVADRVTRGPKAATGRARRLADMRTPVRRLDHRRSLKATPPTRTKARPVPYKAMPVGKLVHTAMRLPKRDGWKLSRPTPVQQRKARRTLVLRSKLAGRRTALKAAKAPMTAAKAAWLHRPLWAYPAIPGAPDPAWTKPTVPEPKARVAPGPKTTAPKNDAPKTRRHRTEYPQKTARRATTTPGGTTMSSSPVQAATEAASMIGGYTAQGVTEYLAFLNQQPEIMQAYGQAYRLHAQRMTTDMPFSASAAGVMADLGAAMIAVEQIAAKLGPALRSAHAEQFDGLENRKPGQAMFDTTNN